MYSQPHIIPASLHLNFPDIFFFLVFGFYFSQRALSISPFAAKRKEPDRGPPRRKTAGTLYSSLLKTQRKSCQK
jgi:hypothetical protein